MKIYSFSFKNIKDRPNEDYFLISKKYPVFAIGDGVSRMKKENGSYPKPSAKIAAEVFCQISVDYLERNYKRANEKVLKEAFNVANRAIFKLNEKYGINKKLDYLINDFLSACGTAVFIKKNWLWYGYIGDCGVRIYSRQDLLKVISINDIAPLEEYCDNLKFKSPEDQKFFWKKILRNKPNAHYLTYGVLTGEAEAEAYYHFGKTKLDKGDLVFIYSDGFLHFIKQPELRKLFRNLGEKKLKKEIKKFLEKEINKNWSKRKTETFGDDKTLISILL